MTFGSVPVRTRVAGSTDVDAIVTTLTSAFFHDPLWGPAFPDLEQRGAQAGTMWRFYVTSALRYPWTLVTQDVEAVAVWIPPGEAELTLQEENRLEDVLVGVAGSKAAGDILEIFGRLDEAHPSEPNFYLSLLGTRSEHRGKGLGMSLLRENLARIDALGAPAYLESSNPANNARYESVGFMARDQVTFASGHVVTTMWRPERRISAP